MQFQELPVNSLFTFHSFSEEVYRKVNEGCCICVSYDDQELDAPHSLTQRVYPIIQKGQTKVVDRFQPITIINELKERIAELAERLNSDSLTVEQRKLFEGMQAGLAYAVVFTTELAMHRCDERESK